MSVPSSPVGLLPAFTPQGVRNSDKFKIHEDAQSDGISLPSSPVMKKRGIVLEEATHHNQQFYPTPMPTSSGAGIYDRSSSPIRAATKVLEKVAHLQAGPVLGITDENANSQVRAPLATLAVMRLSRSGEPVTIGRSSQSCNIAVSSKNKLVSRVHARARFLAKDQTVVIDCLGWNGLTVVVPGENNHLAEYEIAKGQSLTAGFVNGIKLDIRGEGALIAVDEDETDDERPTRLADSPTPPLLPHQQLPREFIPEPLAEKSVTATLNVFTPKDAAPKVTAAPKQTAPTPQQATTKRVAPKQATPTPKKFTKKHRQPEELKEATTMETKQTNAKRPKVDEQELRKMLANHLAFSRLSSTPLSVICKSNSALSKQDKLYVRGLLEQIECTGVIHRMGKDASGRPLEEEYYYIPEKDDDEHRRDMAEQSRGHIGLRSCRKQHKQYFWKKPTK